MESQNKLLLIEKASLKIGESPIFSNISMELKKGDIVLIAGKSGVGKSSLMSIINGFYPNEDASVEVEKLEINSKNMADKGLLERTKYVRSIFQNARLSFAMMTPYEEMIFCLENFKFPVEKMERKILEKVEEYDLENLLHRKFSTLSGGELQRVAFACASLIEAPLYVMDEPFANIDEASIPYFIGKIKELKNAGKGILIIDHRIDFWTWLDTWYIFDEFGNLKKIDLPLTSEDEKLLRRNGLLADLSNELGVKRGKKVLGLEDVSINLPNGEKLIENINFEIYAGQMCALIGKSGAGKTSFFKALLRQVGYEGKIELLGQNHEKMRRDDLYAKIGLVFQDPSLQFVTAKVREELRLSFPNYSESQLDGLLREFDFESISNLSPWLISQGQQRRLAFLTMVGKDKSLLLVDEPTYGQDLRNAIWIMNSLKSLCKKGISCIFTSHDKRLVDNFADRVFLIEDKMIQELTHD